MNIEQSNLAKIFKALSNEQRLAIFKLIYDCACSKNAKNGEIAQGGEESCCGGMYKAFTKATKVMNISRSTISHHMKELQNAGLIVCKRVKQSYYCEVNMDAVKVIRNFLRKK